MPDLLVKLLELPDSRSLIAELANAGILIRRAQPFEATAVCDFIVENFSQGWADEVTPAFSRQPVTCYVATCEMHIVGFGAYECTRRDFFGPTGVSDKFRGKNIGKALLLACLEGMRDMGYVYGIIGGGHILDYYAKCAGATEIPGSDPGIYTDMLEG